MKCQKCKEKEATTHIKKVVNGEYEEYMLCSDCAHSMGYDNIFDLDMPDMFGGLLSSMFSTALPARSQATRCPVCGLTYGDITNTGKVGCAKCYEVFYDQLIPSIKRIHFNTSHCGKVPHRAPSTAQAGGAEQTDDKAHSIKEMKDKLQQAIDRQDFEQAAELRDRIKEAEGSSNE